MSPVDSHQAKGKILCPGRLCTQCPKLACLDDGTQRSKRQDNRTTEKVFRRVILAGVEREEGERDSPEAPQICTHRGTHPAAQLLMTHLVQRANVLFDIGHQGVAHDNYDLTALEHYRTHHRAQPDTLSPECEKER